MRSEMEGDILKVLVTEEQLRARVAEMGAALYDRFQGKTPLFLGVLKGSFVFMADLVRACQVRATWSSSPSALTRTPLCPPAGCRSPTTCSRTSRGGT